MTGGSLQDFVEIWRTIFAKVVDGVEIPLLKIKMRCPRCSSWKIRPNGTKMSGKNRVEAFICKNSKCVKERRQEGYKKGKQFIKSTSYEFQELIRDKLKGLYADLLKDGAKNTTIAKKYGVSPSEISALRREIEKAIESHRRLDSLVDIPQPDRAIAIDETFLKIENKKVYIIVATGYSSRKILGIKVSFSRREKDMRGVFDESERNTKYPITTVTSDAWSGTMAMVKNLGRTITHVIHKHKKPYDKAVIKRYEYSQEERVTTTIGVKADITKRRAKRQGHYMITKTSLNPRSSKKRGRPKGSKNNLKKKESKKKKKRGRRGLFRVFDKGKRFYIKVDPYRKTVRVSKDLPATVAAGLTEVISLFARKSIQNNIAENINSVLQSLLRMRGPKTVESAEKILRAWVIVRNAPDVLNEIQIDRKIRGSFLINNYKVIDLPHIESRVISV